MAKRTTESQTTPAAQVGADKPTGKRPIAFRVFAWCASTGPRAAPECLSIHEIALAKRRAEAQGERIELLPDFHDGKDWIDRERPVTAEANNDERFNGSISLMEEHQRLTDRYTFPGANGQTINLVADVYGPPHQGRLLAVLRRIHIAGRKLDERLRKDGRKLTSEDLSELVALADPEADLSGSTLDLEPATAGAQ
jgi:hypothetical protein